MHWLSLLLNLRLEPRLFLSSSSAASFSLQPQLRVLRRLPAPAHWQAAARYPDYYASESEIRTVILDLEYLGRR
eukprot:959690-Rhodomonas_salina.1